MLTELKNGAWIRLADVRAIRVEQLPRQTGHEPEWAVRIVHDADFTFPAIETCVFDSDHPAHAYAAEIGRLARKAQSEQAAGFNRVAEANCRHDRDRRLDRACVLAAGLLAQSADMSIGDSLVIARESLEALE